MKKRIALLLTVAMVLGLAACGSKTEEPAAAEPAQTEGEAEAETPDAEPAGDDAATPAASGDTVKVAFITQSLSNASQAFAWSQFQKFAGEYGFEVTLFDEDYDAQNGVAAIGTCIAQKYTAICMNPTDPSALIPAIQEAKEAGIIIGLYSSELPEGFATTEYRDFMCGTNDVLFGENAAKTLMEAFPDGCNVVEVGGQSGHAAQINRHDGFFNTIDDSINVLDAQDCQEWASEDAMAIMEDFITKYGSDIQAVYCHWDVGLTGCIEAMKASSDIDIANVYTIGVDGCAIGFDQVKEGTQSLCIGQSFTQMTIDAFDCITTIMNGGTLESDVVWTEPQIITTDTLDDYPYPEW